jgi:hypothetical protein
MVIVVANDLRGQKGTLYVGLVRMTDVYLHGGWS